MFLLFFFLDITSIFDTAAFKRRKDALQSAKSWRRLPFCCACLVRRRCYCGSRVRESNYMVHGFCTEQTGGAVSHIRKSWAPSWLVVSFRTKVFQCILGRKDINIKFIWNLLIAMGNGIKVRNDCQTLTLSFCFSMGCFLCSKVFRTFCEAETKAPLRKPAFRRR